MAVCLPFPFSLGISPQGLAQKSLKKFNELSGLKLRTKKALERKRKRKNNWVETPEAPAGVVLY